METTTNPSWAQSPQSQANSFPSTEWKLDAGGTQTDPVFAPMPTAVNLFLSCWSYNVEPEIWKNLTTSQFRHRKTLFKVNTGIPPSSSRNVEPAGLRSAASQKSPGYGAVLGAAGKEGQAGLQNCFLAKTWSRLGGQHTGLLPLRAVLPTASGYTTHCCPTGPSLHARASRYA